MLRIVSPRDNLFLLGAGFVVIILRVLFTLKTFTLSPDISTQLHTLVNFSNGKGITVNVFENGVITAKPYSAHAPGLVLFLYLANTMTGDVITSAYTVSLFSDLFICLFVFIASGYFFESVKYRMFLVLTTALTVSPFYTCWPADYLATAWAVWSVYFLLLYNQKSKFVYFILSSFFCTISYFVKYSFFPFLAAPFLFVLYRQHIRGRIYSKDSILALFISILLYLICSFTNYLLIGKPAQTVAVDYGFYPENLLQFDSFLFHIGNYEIKVNRIIENISNNLLNWQLISGVLTVLSLLYLINKFIKIYKVKDINSIRNILIVILLIYIVLIVFFLCIMSLVSPAILIDDNWTYVKTTRYYAPVIVLFNITLLYTLIHYKKKLLAYTIISLFTILHMLSFRSVLKVGNFGQDYFAYKGLESRILNTSINRNSDKTFVVLFKGIEKFNDVYYVLNASGIVSIDVDQFTINTQNSEFHFCELKQLISCLK